jgi:hypothetical protein
MSAFMAEPAIGSLPIVFDFAASDCGMPGVFAGSLPGAAPFWGVPGAGLAAPGGVVVWANAATLKITAPSMATVIVFHRSMPYVLLSLMRVDGRDPLLTLASSKAHAMNAHDLGCGIAP